MSLTTLMLAKGLFFPLQWHFPFSIPPRLVLYLVPPDWKEKKPPRKEPFSCGNAFHHLGGGEGGSFLLWHCFCICIGCTSLDVRPTNLTVGSDGTRKPGDEAVWRYDELSFSRLFHVRQTQVCHRETLQGCHDIFFKKEWRSVGC